VLGHLSRNEGISQARLAELTDTDPMTLVRTLDRMQQDEWIERRPGSGGSARPSAVSARSRPADHESHVEARRSGAPGSAVGAEPGRARTAGGLLERVQGALLQLESK
jgi:hypothetical protein